MSSLVRRHAAVLLSAATVLAGCNSPPIDDTCDGSTCAGAIVTPPRIFVSPPFGLGFDCVLMGCMQTQSLSISNRGDGIVRIERVTLTSTSSDDFELELNAELPVDVVKATPFVVPVHYAPTDAEPDQGNI